MPERRQYPRTYLPATVAIFCGDTHLADYLVQNLSVGGVLLVGGPPIEPGVQVRAVIRISGASVLEIDGLVVRQMETDEGLVNVGVTFQHSDPNVRGALQHYVLRSLGCRLEATVLVVHREQASLAALAEALLDGGRQPILAFTWLEAVHWLSEPNSNVETVLFGAGASDIDSEFFQFLRDEHPTVRRILVRDGEDPIQLRPARGDCVVQEVLCAPWTRVKIDLVLQARPMTSWLTRGVSAPEPPKDGRHDVPSTPPDLAP